MGAHGPPVDALLRIGPDLERDRARWHDYLALGIGPEHVPDLIRLAEDPELLADVDDDEEGVGDAIWAPYHAWRVLGLLRAESAIPTLMNILATQDEDTFSDWIVEELPVVFGMIGTAALPPLTALFEREDAGQYAREDAALSLVEIARAHPEARAEVVATLTRQLERAEWHAPSFNAWIVADLIDLGAKESAEVIERAYAGQFVDESICGTWYDVWHSLELEGEPPPRPANSYLDRPADPGPYARARYAWQPVDIKSPDERKGRNKARQKLELKVKGRGKKKGSKRR